MIRMICLACAACVAVLAPSRAVALDPFAETRAHMVASEIKPLGIANQRVLEAIGATPRHEFVAPEEHELAYLDMAVPIGHGQSISPPYVVAFMTEKLDPQSEDRVLEIGTGSGYQAAVLSPLVKDVYTIEIVEPLGRTAGERLKRLGYSNVHVRVGDGYKGWPDAAPFDKIIVTCSPEKIPQPLIDQLKVGGRLIVPLGERFQQRLYLFTKTADGLMQTALEPTMFVPMTGEAEAQRVKKPDPTKPAIENGSFETAFEDDVTSGWYYIRQARIEEDASAPEGESVLRFQNHIPGRAAQAQQAFALDGRTVGRLDWSLFVRLRDVAPGQKPDQAPRLVVVFFDAQREPIGEESLGPWTGDMEWTKQQGIMRVPPKTTMAIVWIGLLGATGEAAFDHVRVAPMESNPSVFPSGFQSLDETPTGE